MSFAQNLEYLMKERNMSRYRLAKLSGYSQTTIANWIGGKTTPYPKDREQIASIFNVSVEELMGEQLPTGIKKENPPSKDDGLEKERVIWSQAWDNATPEQRQAALAVLKLQVPPSEG